MKDFFDPIDLFRMDNEVAVITGAGTGLGLAFAQCFARVGATAILLDRDKAAAEQAAAGIIDSGDTAAWFELDVT